MKSHTDLINTKGPGVVAGETLVSGTVKASIVLAYDRKDLKMVLVLFGDDKENRRRMQKRSLNVIQISKVNKPVAKGKKVTRF